MPIPVSGDNGDSSNWDPPSTAPLRSCHTEGFGQFAGRYVKSGDVGGSARCGSRRAGEGFWRSGSAVPWIAYNKFVSAEKNAGGANAIISAVSAHSAKMAMNRRLTWSGMFVSFPSVLHPSAAGHQDNGSANTAGREKPHSAYCAPGLLSAGLPPGDQRRLLRRTAVPSRAKENSVRGVRAFAWISDRPGPRPLGSRATPPCCRRSGPRAPTIHRASTRRVTPAKRRGCIPA